MSKFSDKSVTPSNEAIGLALKAFFQRAALNDPELSQQRWAAEAGLNSSSLSRTLNGQRDLTLVEANTLILALRLPEADIIKLLRMAQDIELSDEFKKLRRAKEKLKATTESYASAITNLRMPI